MTRALSGDVANLSLEKTGIDLRMVKDVEPLIIKDKLSRMAERMKLKKVVSFLDEQERYIRAEQYSKFQTGLRDDISKLGLAFGTIAPDQGVDNDLA